MTSEHGSTSPEVADSLQRPDQPYDPDGSPPDQSVIHSLQRPEADLEVSPSTAGEEDESVIQSLQIPDLQPYDPDGSPPDQSVIHSLQIPDASDVGALGSPLEADPSFSRRRPESDLDAGSSSYVPSLCSPTTRDSLDEGYDPDETLKIVVYDNEDIKISSSGMYHDNYSEDEDDEEDDDNRDVVYLSSRSSVADNLNQLVDLTHG